MWKTRCLLYILCDSIYITSLKWQNYGNGKQISDCQGLRRRWGGREMSVTIKGQNRGSLWCWKSSVVWLYPWDKVGILYYNIFANNNAKCYHWGKLVKEYRSLCIISYSCICIYNYLKIKILIKNADSPEQSQQLSTTLIFPRTLCASPGLYFLNRKPGINLPLSPKHSDLHLKNAHKRRTSV